MKKKTNTSSTLFTATFIGVDFMEDLMAMRTPPLLWKKGLLK